MIIKHAHHFLTSEGKTFFPGWVEELQEIAARYPGFDAVWPMSSGEELEETHLFMVFTDEAAYQRWIVGTDHARILDALAMYSVKSWQANTYVSIASCMK